MARSLDLPEELMAKLDSPRAKVFTTIKRVFDSSAGRDYLMVEPDKDHGLRGRTTKAERSGPRNLDSGLSEISIVFQAAVPKLVASKYTTSGVRRPSEL